jgi:hypothetical protein
MHTLRFGKKSVKILVVGSGWEPAQPKSFFVLICFDLASITMHQMSRFATGGRGFAKCGTLAAACAFSVRPIPCLFHPLPDGEVGQAAI